MKHTALITLLLLAIFFSAQVLGLVVVNQYIDEEKTAETGEVAFKELPANLTRPEVPKEQQSTSFIYIIGAVLIGTVLLLLLIKFKIFKLWKLWFFIAVIATLFIAFGAFVPSIVAFVGALALAIWKVWRPNIIVQNMTELFIYGGLAAIFVPILNLFAAVMLLILLSVYDMYAVWKSKHMITLAKFQSEEKIFAGLLIPYHVPKSALSAETRKAANMGKKLKEKAKGKMISVRSAVLGGGDIGFPLLFAGVVLKEVGLLQSMIIPVFATIALGLLLWFSKKERFYPAMPFLTIGCLAGYGVVWLL